MFWTTQGAAVRRLAAGGAALDFEALSAPKKAAVVEHVAAGRVQGPVAALAGSVWSTRKFNKTVVEG